MSRVSRRNKMLWIHLLCSLQANYMWQRRPKLWGFRHCKLDCLGCPDTHRGYATVSWWSQFIDDENDDENDDYDDDVLMCDSYSRSSVSASRPRFVIWLA